MKQALLVPPVVAGLAIVLFVLERFAPLRQPTRPLRRRMWVNLAVAASAFAVAGFLVAPVSVSVMHLSGSRGFGLIPWLGLSSLPAGIVGFLAMDLTFYAWHRANHEVPFLWRFHAAHHVDPDLDVTTSFRFHPGEIALSAGFRVVQLGLLGIPASVLLVYEAVFLGGTVFHHSNLRLPVRLERVLHAVLVTPRMHGVHHSQVLAETNANYSVVLPWWDHLFRTIHLDVPQDRLRIGVPAWDGERGEGLWTAASVPLRPPSEHRRRPDGERPERHPPERTGRPGRITP